MIFDSFDEAYLKLCGLCRYLPTGLQKRYDSPLFTRAVIANLEGHRLIKRQSNNQSFKLSHLGKKVLGEMGYQFPEDARMNLKRPAYQRKLKNAAWNVLLYLAGIDVFGGSVRELSGRETGYVSSLMVRSDTNMRVLAGTKYFGILKLFDTVYIPYYAQGWLIPGHEMEIFKSQAGAVQCVSHLCLLLMGETLEEAWDQIHPPQKSEPMQKGMRPIDRALEEMPYDTVLLPLNRDGVFQMRVMACREYRSRIARGLGCDTQVPKELGNSDGLCGGIPYIVGIDLNMERIARALKQIAMHRTAVPKIVCFPFQKNVLIKGLALYGCQKTILVSLDKKSTHSMFPEMAQQLVREPCRTKEGGYVSVHERTNKGMGEKTTAAVCKA